MPDCQISLRRRMLSPSAGTVRVAALLAVVLWMPAVLPAAGDDEAEAATPPPLEKITFEAEAPSGLALGEKTIAGKVVADLGGGNLLLMDRGGRIWPITPDRLMERETTDKPFKPYTQDEMIAALKEELGEGFLFIKMRHYIICTETNRQYANWAGSLFERLLSAFETLWDRKPLDVREPEFPLCAIIFKNKDRFLEYSKRVTGPDVLNALGYYSTLTNRMIMYDLTGGQRPRNLRELRQRMSRQINNVSTIVHEATHQVAFNTTIHQRLAPNPFWLVEGMAMFFETPDLTSRTGWRTVGALNTSRMRDYREYLRGRYKPGSLRKMIASDERFHDSETALDAYSEAWALSYFLIWARRDEYVAYLNAISEKEMLAEETAEDRIAEFEKHVGNIEKIEREMIQYLARKVR